MAKVDRVTLQYGGQSVSLCVGDFQTAYKGPRGPGGEVTVDGFPFKVANWGPQYISFRGAEGRYFQISYTSRAYTAPPPPGDAWGRITSMIMGQRQLG